MVVLRRMIEELPDGASVTWPVGWLRELLEEEAGEEDVREPQAPDPRHVVVSELTWRERLWSCPAETRLGMEEVCEALDRSKSWVYRRTGNAADPEGRLPCRRLDGVLVFTAGELRTWIRDHEEVVFALPHESTPEERGRLRAVEGSEL